MNEKGHQFSTFAGVFTPSILTILGVIMFLRAGYVTGEAGILNTILILLAAEAISILENDSKRDAMIAKLARVRDRLGRGGASKRTARIALEMMTKGVGLE